MLHVGGVGLVETTFRARSDPDLLLVMADVLRREADARRRLRVLSVLKL